MKCPRDPVEFVALHGVVLASAKGPVPNLAEAIAGESIRGSWWAHPKGTDIFNALSLVGDSPDVLTFRLVEGKITFVHRRLWPALIRLAGELKKEQLTAVRQEHTQTGAHRNVLTPFARWASADLKTSAKRMSETEARAQLGEWLAPPKAQTSRRRRSGAPRR
jgi:hypothetical protein